jgi:hypothetical protein
MRRLNQTDTCLSAPPQKEKRLLLVGEVGAKFCGDSGCHMASATDPLWLYSQISKPESLLFLPSSTSIVLMRLSGPRSRPKTHYFLENLVVPGIEPGPLHL